MLLDEIKKRVGEAIKARNDVEREVLRLTLGELQTLEARTGHPATDDEAAQVIRKLIKSNEETKAASSADAARTAALDREIAVLTSLLPKGLDVAEIVAKLGPVADAIKAAGNDGQATGIAIKHLKAAGISAPGGDVSKAVKAIRGGG
jgi:uncharacterized protein YqeY